MLTSGNVFPGIDAGRVGERAVQRRLRYIHTLPKYQHAEAEALGARRVLTVHHSKYALARHRWDEPLENVRKLAEDSSLEVLCPMIGEVVEWSVK